LPHKNIVREMVRLGTWKGEAKRFDLPASADPTLSAAMLVQNLGPARADTGLYRR
jgi:hypothetical protein